MYEKEFIQRTDNKTENIKIRCTREEKEYIEKQSNLLGITMSEYILDQAVSGRMETRADDLAVKEATRELVLMQERVNAFVGYVFRRYGAVDPYLSDEIKKLLMGGQ